jgi:sugar lactone lactonase YvrE
MVRITLSSSGALSTATVVTEQEQLRTIDGICFDRAGQLDLAVNQSNRLYRLDPSSGGLTRLADRSDGLAYPTQPAFLSSTLYLTNGALPNGVADLEAFDVAATGLSLPRP